MYPPIRSFLSCLALVLSCGHGRAGDSPQWLTYAGGEGPGKGRHIVIIAADQE